MCKREQKSKYILPKSNNNHMHKGIIPNKYFQKIIVIVPFCAYNKFELLSSYSKIVCSKKTMFKELIEKTFGKHFNFWILLTVFSSSLEIVFFFTLLYFYFITGTVQLLLQSFFFLLTKWTKLLHYKNVLQIVSHFLGLDDGSTIEN